MTDRQDSPGSCGLVAVHQIRCLLWYDRPVVALYAGPDHPILAWLIDELRPDTGAPQDMLAGYGLPDPLDAAFKADAIDIHGLRDAGAPAYHLRLDGPTFLAWRVPALAESDMPAPGMTWSDLA